MGYADPDAVTRSPMACAGNLWASLGLMVILFISIVAVSQRSLCLLGLNPLSSSARRPLRRSRNGLGCRRL
jgi:hypothetical protein